MPAMIWCVLGLESSKDMASRYPVWTRVVLPLRKGRCQRQPELVPVSDVEYCQEPAWRLAFVVPEGAVGGTTCPSHARRRRPARRCRSTRLPRREGPSRPSPPLRHPLCRSSDVAAQGHLLPVARPRQSSHLNLKFVALVLFDPKAEALDGGEDVVGGPGPLEGSGIFVVRLDEGADVGLKLEGGAVPGSRDPTASRSW